MSFVSMHSPTLFFSTVVKHVDLQDCGLSKTFDTTFTITAFVRLFPSVSVNVRLHVASTRKRLMTFFTPRRLFSTVGDYVLIVLNRKHLQCHHYLVEPSLSSHVLQLTMLRLCFLFESTLLMWEKCFKNKNTNTQMYNEALMSFHSKPHTQARKICYAF